MRGLQMPHRGKRIRYHPLSSRSVHVEGPLRMYSDARLVANALVEAAQFVEMYDGCELSCNTLHVHVTAHADQNCRQCFSYFTVHRGPAPVPVVTYSKLVLNAQ